MSWKPCLRASKTWCSKSGLPPTGIIGFGDESNRAGAGRRRQVETIEATGGAFIPPKHGINQLAHVQIRLFLCAVAEHLEFGGVPAEFLQKVINRAVGGAATDHVGKAE